MDAAPQVGDKCQYHSPPKDEDSLSTQETPTILGNLNDLLRSPYPPSHADIQQIRSYIEHESKRCNQEIASEQLKPKTHIKLCRSLLAPIRRLPNEILENIFAMTCLSEHGCYSLRVYDAPKHERLPHIAPTLTLTHVSYRWRLLVNGSAGLWSSIKVEITGLTKGRMNIESLLELYLTRSKAYPLDLRFWQYPGYDDTVIASMICPHIPRITKLDLCTETEDSSVSLRVPDLDQLWDAFRTKAPRLSTVKMVRPLGFDWLPYHQLAILEIQEVYDCRYLIRWIQLCTRLHTLKFSIFDKATHTNNNIPSRIEAPSVRHLSVGAYSDDELSFISQYIGFPSLVSLEISTCGSMGISLAPLTAAASGRNLRKLVFKGYGKYRTSMATELCRLLRSCPELSELEACCLDLSVDLGGPCNERTLTYHLLKMLCQAPTPENSGVVLPCLTELSVLEQDSYVDAGTVNSLLDMLDMRIDNSAPVSRTTWDVGFRVLSLHTEDEIEALNARLESLGRRGVVCRIKWARVYIEEDC